MADRDMKIRVLLEALDRYTRPMQAANKETKATTDRLKVLREEQRRLDQAARRLTALKTLREDMRGASNAALEAKRRAKELGAQVASVEQPTKKLRLEYEKQQETVRRLMARQREQVTEFTRLKGQLKEVIPEVRSLSDAETELRRRTEATSASIGEQASKMDRLAERRKRIAAGRASATRIGTGRDTMAAAGAGAISAGLVAAAPLVAGGRAAMDFESTMADVNKVVGFKSARELQAYSNSLLDLADRMPVTASGLAQISAEGARSGVALRELRSFTEDSAKLKVAFDFEDEAAASETLTAWRNAFKLTQPEAMKLANQVNALTNASGGRAADVADLVARVGGLGSVAGVSTGAVAALGQTLVKMKVEPEVAATGIKNLMLRLTAGAAATPKMSKAFKQLGLDARTVSKNMQIDSEGTILNVLERVRKLPKDQQPGILTEIFGRESIEPIAQLMTQLDQVREAFALVKNDQAIAGSVNKEYATRMGVAATSVSMLKNNVVDMAISALTPALPLVRELSSFVGSMAIGIRKWAEAHPGLAKILAVTLAIISGLLLVFGGLALAVAALLAPFAALAFVAGALGIGLLPLLGIIIAIVAVVAALAAAAFLIWKYWKPVMAWFAAQWAAFKDFGRMMIDGLIQGISANFNKLKDKVVGVAKAAAGWFREKLGIHSPSRVFAEMGVHTMSGLAQGIDRGARAPLQRVARVAGRLTAATAIGMSPMAAAAQPAGQSGPQQANHYEVHFHPAPGMDERKLFAMFEKWVAGQGAGGGRRRAAYADED